MLDLNIPSVEVYNDDTNEFINSKGGNLKLEHSLVSLAKWESKWGKPFLSDSPKTVEETIDYIKCMTITQNVNDNIYRNLSSDNIEAVNNYINAPMTATTFSKSIPGTGKGTSKREVITAELIYYWMIALNVPLECQKWHLNRLLTLIRVCDIKNNPGKKMSRKEALSRNKALNAQRRAKLGTTG